MAPQWPTAGASWGGPMTWLASLPAGVLVPTDERESVSGIVDPLMAALGATFAVRMALTAAIDALSGAPDLEFDDPAGADQPGFGHRRESAGDGLMVKPSEGARVGEVSRYRHAAS